MYIDICIYMYITSGAREEEFELRVAHALDGLARVPVAVHQPCVQGVGVGVAGLVSYVPESRPDSTSANLGFRYRGTSLIRNSSPPWDHDRALGIFLL